MFVVDTRRDFVYVDDLVEVVIAAGAGRATATTTSPGSDFAIKELFDADVAALGIELDEEVEVRPAPRRTRLDLLDPARTESDFDW